MPSTKTSLLAFAFLALAAGLISAGAGHVALAGYLWGAGTVPVAAGLLLAMIQDLRAGRVGVDAIAFISMLAALALAQPLAAVVVALMYAGGNVLEEYAIGRAERSLKSLVDRAPRIAHRRTQAGLSDVPVEAVVIGDSIVVRAGQVVPVDGIVTSPDAVLDEAALTGEPIPVRRRRGEAARSGALNAGETFDLRATATASESTYAGIVRMASVAQTAKAPFIRLADRFAILLLPLTLAVAGVAWIFSGDPVRALAVLVAATPCPLILAAPVAFIGGVSRAAAGGILVKGGGPLERLAEARTVLFDKTGTLTVGGARLIAVEVRPGEGADHVLGLAASLEQASHHVVAAAIVKAAASRGIALAMPADVREAQGSGLEGQVGQNRVRVGSYAYVNGSSQPEEWASRAQRRASWRSALGVFVACDGRPIGALLMGDELRRETPRAVEALRAAGLKRIVMLTGDRADAAETIGAALDLDAVLADRVPKDKVDAVMTERRQRTTVMVGDGLNDAPALAAADVGIAMGARGASASSEAADVVIVVDRLDKVAEAVAIAKRTRRIALESVFVGLALSGAAMVLAAFGYLSPVAGAVTQEGIDVAVILNALRTLLPAGHSIWRAHMPDVTVRALHQGHDDITHALDRLREIADALDDAAPQRAVELIGEANQQARLILAHERSDESTIYPSLAAYLPYSHGLNAMSRAHREIVHLGRLLDRLAGEATTAHADRYFIRDAQRTIEAIESLVRLHNAQEEDLYDQASAS